MAHVNPGGHNFGPPNLDSLGIFYTTMSIIFTLCVWLSLIPIWMCRGIPSIKMRKPHLIIASVFLLQIYLIIITNVYTMNGNFPCGLEFWVMSLIFPRRCPISEAAFWTGLIARQLVSDSISFLICSCYLGVPNSKFCFLKRFLSSRLVVALPNSFHASSTIGQR